MEQEISGGSARLLGIAPRVGTIVLAVILIGVSAGTIGVISSNETLESVRGFDRNDLTSVGKDLQDLIIRSQGAAGWFIVLGIGVLIAETVAIILTIFLAQKLVMQVIDIIFSFIVAFCYGVTGIACATYAAAWGGPPDGCDNDSADCDDVALTATTALSTVFSFIQAAVFGFIAFMVIFTIVKNKKT